MHGLLSGDISLGILSPETPIYTNFKSFVNASSATRTSGKQVVIVLPDKIGLFELLVRKGQSETAFG